MTFSLEEQENIIKTRSPKKLGGYVSENMFLQRLFKEYPDIEYTKGWWGARGMLDFYFFVVKDSLNSLDRKIIDLIEKNGYIWRQILLCNGEIRLINDIVSESVKEFTDNHRISRYRNRDRKFIYKNTERCIEYLKNNDMLESTAKSIFIEEEFLNKYYFVVNYDLIYILNNKITACEVKFKNEFMQKIDNKRTMVFGVDKENYDKYLRKLMECGIEVANIVLYNYIKTTNENSNSNRTLIFDYLDGKGNLDDFWKVHVFDPKREYPIRYGSNRPMSGWDESYRTDNVYCIPLKECRDFFEYSLPEKYKADKPEGAWGYIKDTSKLRVIREYHPSGDEFLWSI